MTQREKTKWNNRHFQICLALIQRPTTDHYDYTKPLVMEDVINKADKMVRVLQEREKRSSDCGGIDEKVAK